MYCGYLLKEHSKTGMQEVFKTNMTIMLILCYQIVLPVSYLCEVSRVKIFFKEMFIFGQTY